MAKKTDVAETETPKPEKECPCIEACKKIAEMKKTLCECGMGESQACSTAIDVWKQLNAKK